MTIYNEELSTLGTIRYGRQHPQPPKDKLLKFWTGSVPCISRKPYFIDVHSRPAVAAGFSRVIQRLKLKAPACAIMNDHVHILILRSKYSIEYIVNQLKGAATAELKLKQTPWSRGCWKVFINDTETLAAAADYIRANPAAAGLPDQSWDFVTPLFV
jgi:REP element-mobilizing transposase RayT